MEHNTADRNERQQMSVVKCMDFFLVKAAFVFQQKSNIIGNAQCDKANLDIPLLAIAI